MREGDLVAMKFTDTTTHKSFYGFADVNSADDRGAAHLWNYAMNTWGWDDLSTAGTRDYTDLVVQLDFTSLAGSELLK